MIRRGTILLTLIASAAAAQPYPASTAIESVSYNWGSAGSSASGSDNWPATWASNGHQYLAWGDGGGFGGSGSAGRVELGIARIEGPYDSWTGHNVWGLQGAGQPWDSEHPATFGGKCYGILSSASVLWGLWIPGSGAANWDSVRVMSSTDFSATWTLGATIAREADGVGIPTFLNFGQDYAGARDNYVYAYWVGIVSASALQVQTPGRIYLSRVPRGSIATPSAWEWYTGAAGGTSGTPTWGAIGAKTAVFQDLTNGVGWCLSVSYLDGPRRYILMTENTLSSTGRVGMFDSPQPWGPWTTVEYYTVAAADPGGWHDGHQANNVFLRGLPSKWNDEDDTNQGFVMVYTGTGGSDRFLHVSGTFVFGAEEPPGGGGCGCP